MQMPTPNAAGSSAARASLPEPLIQSERIQTIFKSLYADAAKTDPLVRQAIRDSGVVHATEAAHYNAMRSAYMPVGPEFGRLLYLLARALASPTIVEFGTSFGVSTLYLACAVRDSGGGKVITTEFEPSKVDRARANLKAAGLDEWVEFRVGDALESLRVTPGQVDMVLLDGSKSMYLNVLTLLEPRLRRGGIVASDNTDHQETTPLLDYVRNPANGYTSSAVVTGGTHAKPHEISIRN